MKNLTNLLEKAIDKLNRIKAYIKVSGVEYKESYLRISDTYMKPGKTFEGVRVLELKEDGKIHPLDEFYELQAINEYK